VTRLENICDQTGEECPPFQLRVDRRYATGRRHARRQDGLQESRASTTRSGCWSLSAFVRFTNLDALTFEHALGTDGESRLAISDEEPNGSDALGEGRCQVGGLRCYFVQRAATPGVSAWARLNGSSLRLLTFYSEGFTRTAYAAHCIQRGALRLALVSLKVCSCALGHPPPYVVGSPF
jgi:hypothetical protein